MYFDEVLKQPFINFKQLILPEIPTEQKMTDSNEAWM